MARINIEDTLWSDARFLKFCIKIGCEASAIGNIVLAWRTAHKYWCPDRKPIPEHAFKEAGLSELLIECNLADRTKDGIRIRGSEEHFAWWFQRQEAGKRGAAATNAKRWGSSTDERESTDVERPVGKSRQKSPSSSSSSSSSSSDSSSLIPIGEKKTASLPSTKVSGLDVSRLISVYIKSYQTRYGSRPDVGGKTQGVFKRLLNDYSVSQLSDLIQVYCQMSDPWLQTKHHDAVTFENNINKVLYALEHGKERTKEDIEKERKKQEDDAFYKKMKEELEASV